MSIIFDLELNADINETIKKNKIKNKSKNINKFNTLNINYKSNPQYYNIKFKYLNKLNLLPSIIIYIEKNKSNPIFIPQKKLINL